KVKTVRATRPRPGPDSGAEHPVDVRHAVGLHAGPGLLEAAHRRVVYVDAAALDVAPEVEHLRDPEAFGPALEAQVADRVAGVGGQRVGAFHLGGELAVPRPVAGTQVGGGQLQFVGGAGRVRGEGDVVGDALGERIPGHRDG